MAKTDMEKLVILLQHWIEHTEDHTKEFEEWAEKAADLGHIKVRDEIGRAVEKMSQANEHLLSALAQLGTRS